MSSQITLYHSNCLDILPTLEAGSVDAVVTDPPYNAINRDTGGLRVINKGGADSLPIDIEALANEFERIVSGSIYIWCSDEQYTEWTMALKRRGFTTRICAWWKKNPSPMNGQYLWLSALELCVFGRKSEAYFGKYCAHPIWREPVAQSNGHPTPKPIGLMVQQVLASVPEGGTVLDPFMGSGTTGVACVQTNRNFIGIEIDQGYFEIAEKRITEAQAQPSLFDPPAKPDKYSQLKFEPESDIMIPTNRD